MPFKVNFITYKGAYRSVWSDKLNVPAIDGQRTLLNNHMDVILPLTYGTIETLQEGELRHWAISDGMLMFRNNEATVLSNHCFAVEDIDKTRVEASLMRARASLESADREIDIQRAKLRISMLANMIDASSKYGK